MAEAKGKKKATPEETEASTEDLVEATSVNAAAVAAAAAARSRAIPPVPVRLSRTQIQATPDLLLWWLIEESTNDLSFKNYHAFINYVLCGEPLPERIAGTSEDTKIRTQKPNRYFDLKKRRFLPFTDTDAHRLLKVATEAFLVVNCAVKIDDVGNADLVELLDRISATDDGNLKTEYLEQYLIKVNGAGSKTLPYLELIMRKLPELRDKIKTQIFKDYTTLQDLQRDAEDCYGILQEKLTYPCMIELIWSYWHEQGMLVQTVNALSRRFQNIRGSSGSDPLALVEFDPLRPLNNLLWGYIQDEQHRLSLVRRVYEYDHHYGLTLEGKAIPELHTSDSRNRFLEAFHHLLYQASIFYKQDDDTTVIADGFPVLNALKDVHMLLSEGAHNQFGDLPSTARIEMLMQQWLLARPEIREVLPTRIMVAYPEEWMDRVDAMKKLQGWVDTSVLHFRNLGVYGEQILLSIRFGAWSDVSNPDQASVWARFWRAKVLGYIHAYRSVTGVDLTADISQSQHRARIAAQPSVLLRQRLQSGRPAPALPSTTPAPQTFRERRAARKAASGSK